MIASGGKTPFHAAVMLDNIVVAKAILEKFPQTADIPDTASGSTPLITATEDENTELVQLLLTSNLVDINVQRSKTVSDGNSAIQLAALYGYSEIVQLLFKHGADINCKDPQTGQTPFFDACAGGHTECVKALLHHRDVNHVADCDEFQNSGLHIAASKGHFDIVKLLCEREILKEGFLF